MRNLGGFFKARAKPAKPAKPADPDVAHTPLDPTSPHRPHLNMASATSIGNIYANKDNQSILPAFNISER